MYRWSQSYYHNKPCSLIPIPAPTCCFTVERIHCGEIHCETAWVTSYDQSISTPHLPQHTTHIPTAPPCRNTLMLVQVFLTHQQSQAFCQGACFRDKTPAYSHLLQHAVLFPGRVYNPVRPGHKLWIWGGLGRYDSGQRWCPLYRTGGDCSDHTILNWDWSF